MNKKEDTAVGFILGNVPVELLTFEQELNYGTIIQAHLKKVEEANGVDFADSVYKDALAQLTNHNIKLVVKVAKDYKGYKLPLEDLIQEGTIGLMTAVKKYDPERGFRFSTAAVPWIRQAITRYIAEKRKIIRYPVHVAEAMSKINKATERFSEREHRNPTAEELSKEMKGLLTPEKITMYLTATQPIASLNAIIGDEENGELQEIVADPNGETPQEYTEKQTNLDLLDNLISTLTPREQQTVALRYGHNYNNLNPEGKEYTLEEVGKIMKFTRERVRQIEKEAILKMKVNAKKKGMLD